MLDYGILEAEIADRLNARFETETYTPANLTENAALPNISDFFESRPRPEKEAEMKRFMNKGIAWVKYADSLYTESQSIDQIAQRETVKVQVFLQTDNLRGATGYYKLLRWVKLALVGYVPSNCSLRLAISDHKEVSYQNGEWVYMLEFKTETTVTQEEWKEPLIGGDFKGLI